MENASKALIIAGAILISILLITIGIILINSGRDVTDTATTQMSSQKIQTFNAQFTAYEGTKKGSEIKGLTSLVTASNTTDDAHQVTVTTKNHDKLVDLSSTKEYKVTLHYATGTGDTLTGAKKAVGPTTITTEKGYIYEIEITND